MNKPDNPLKERPIDISIVIVSFNTCDLTRKCLTDVARSTGGMACEVFVVDNASLDGSADMVEKEFPAVRLIRIDKNRGFAGGNNPAIKEAVGRYVLLLNSDAFLVDGVLEKSIQYMDSNEKTGVLGCSLTNPDGSMQPSARMLPGPLNKTLHISGLAARFPRSKFFGRVDFSWWDHSTPRNVGWVVGAFFLIRSELIDEIGGLDERYFLYFEEIDYCLAAKKNGWDVIYYPDVKIVHLGGQSSVRTGEKISPKGRQLLSVRLKSEFRYYRKWFGIIYVLLSAGIEIIWNCIVFVRNCIRFSPTGTTRRHDARIIIRLIISTLMTDRFGNVGDSS